MAGFLTTRSQCKTSKHKKGNILTLFSCCYAASNRKRRKFCELSYTPIHRVIKKGACHKQCYFTFIKGADFYTGKNGTRQPFGSLGGLQSTSTTQLHKIVMGRIKDSREL